MSSSSIVSGEQLVFIYGTLKQGFPNHVFMPKSAEFVASVKTADSWPLVVDPEMNVPFLLHYPNEKQAKQVYGELYKVDAPALNILDDFEGVPTGFYIRLRIPVIQNHNPHDQLPIDSQSFNAYAYFRHPQGGGPQWVHSWPAEKLFTLPMLSLYTIEQSEAFVRREHRDSD